MASSSSSVFSVAFTPLRLRSHHRHRHLHLHLTPVTSPARVRSPLRAYRKPPNYPQWCSLILALGGEGYGGDDDDEEEEEEEEDDRSLDLLARFVENVFRKVSRRARKAVRSVLPPSISSKLSVANIDDLLCAGVSKLLIRFSVNGVMILAFLWILKAFLEVVCTVGSMVFVSVILVRGVFSGIFYIKERQHYRHYSNKREEDNSAWSGAQPAT